MSGQESAKGEVTVRQGNNSAPSASQLPGLPNSFLQDGPQIAGPAVHITTRLRDHIERMDDGAVHAADDLAVVLRALLCQGKGNGVLYRLYRGCGVSRPEVLLSRPPKAEASTQFSVGSIPTREAGATKDGAVSVPLTKWPNVKVLTITLGGKQRIFTWSEFLDSYANKWGGAHLDAAVPEHLQFIDYYAAGGLSLSNYLLRTAAVEAWLLAQNVYHEVLRKYAPGSFKTEELQEGVYSSPGGVTAHPRDISNRGELQWFHHGTDRLGLLWYVDQESSNNALHLCLGKIHYDVSYNQTPPSQPISAAFQAPRHRINKQTIIDRGELKSLTLDGEIKTFTQVREAASLTEGEG